MPGKIDNTVTIKMFSLYFSAICFWQCFMLLFILANAYLGNNINTVIFWHFYFHLKHLKCLTFIIKVIFEVLFDLWLNITLINEIDHFADETFASFRCKGMNLCNDYQFGKCSGGRGFHFHSRLCTYPLRMSLVKVWISAFCPTVRNLDTILSLYSKMYSHMCNYFYSLLSNTNPALLSSK